MGVKKHAKKRNRNEEKTSVGFDEQVSNDEWEIDTPAEGLQRVKVEDRFGDEPVAKRLREKEKKQRKKERFIVTRMWLSTFVSKFFSDRGTIPDNIGNNILVTNNLIITKNNLTAIIQVQEMSEVTPLAWTSDLMQHVKDQTSGVLIDIVLKGNRYYPDIKPQSISSRVKTWEAMLNNPNMPESYARRAARCMYTLDVIRSNVPIFKRYVYILIRAKDGATLKSGLQATTGYLSSIGARYKRLQSNVDEHVRYFMMMSNKKPAYIKDLPPIIFSTQTLAESLPVIQGANDAKGVLMGYDVVSGFPYYIDFKTTAAAKNIMIEALSGWGKSFMATYWLYPFFADGFNLAIMDIKGNEFGALTEALGGVTLSMRPTSQYYINTYVWRTEEVFNGDYRTYANERIRECKERILCIADFEQKFSSQAESLLEEFLQYVYKSIGASIDNINTWQRTEKLNPYVIFDMFTKYVSLEIRAKYTEVVTKLLERMRIYMSPTGSRAGIYRKAYSYLDVLDSKVLTFDFGLMESSSNNDPVLFHLHVMDMVAINDAYVSHKKRKGEWTVKLLEESQIVDDWLTKVYTREMTLRRSQNQCTVLLGNSVAALAANPLSRPIVENINILCLGSLNKSSRKYLQDEFGLKPAEADRLEDIQTNPDRQRQFLLINRMEKDSTTAILEANVPEEVSQSSLFKIVDTEE